MITILKESWMKNHFFPLYKSIKKVVDDMKDLERAEYVAQYFKPFPHLIHLGITAPRMDKILMPKIIDIIENHNFFTNTEEVDNQEGVYGNLKKKQKQKSHQKQSKVSDLQNSIALDREVTKFLHQLLMSNVFEEKRIAIIYMKHIVSKRGKGKYAWCYHLNDEQLSSFIIEWLLDLERTVLQGSCSDWASCDTLSSAIGVILERDWNRREDAMKIIKRWRFGLPSDDITQVKEEKDTSNANIPNQWLQRLACVSHLKAAKQKKYHDDIYTIVEEVIKNSSRFAQLGAGWVIRETSVVDLDRAVNFIKSTYFQWTREGLRYAIEKMSPELRKEMLDYGRELNKLSGENRKNPLNDSMTSLVEDRKESAKKRRRLK